MRVVRKQLFTNNKEDFERENRNLRLLNQLQHPNIISLLGSYTHAKKNNFLFPYIDMDLKKFLTAEAPHRNFKWDFTFYSALAGLASALSKTHSLQLNQADHDVDFVAIGYHHDLRPPNVLVTADTFVLADFGLGRLRGAEELSHTPFKWNLGDYSAPESTDKDGNAQVVNRAIDVWAFGCLAAEVITYMLKGSVGVQEFRTRRSTQARLSNWKDTSFHDPHGHVKNEVVNWIETLRNEIPHSDLIHQLFQISLDALQPNLQTRPDMGSMHRRLAHLSIKKYFECVQSIFQEVQGTQAESESVAHHHIEFRFAQERLEVWGEALALNKNINSTHYIELPDRYVGIMQKLFRRLGEESEKPSLRDGVSLLPVPFQEDVRQRVDELWKLLPSNLIQGAEEHWKERLVKMRLSQQISSPHDAPPILSAILPQPPDNALQPKFEEVALWFKNGLPNFVSMEEISKIASISDVYSNADGIQTDQYKYYGGIRDLPKIKLYLERLEGYVTGINFIIRGNCNILALIWGPIVLLLRRSKPLGKAYDSLIDAIAAVGEIMPDFQSLVPIADMNIEAKEIMVLLFKDILNIYHEALQPFIHPSKCHPNLPALKSPVRLTDSHCQNRLDAYV